MSKRPNEPPGKPPALPPDEPPGQRRNYLPASRASGSSGGIDIAHGRHLAGYMGFSDNSETREESWRRLPPRVLERLDVPAGDTCLEWWATSYQSAAMFRRQALVTAEKRDGRPIVRTVPLDPASHRMWERHLFPDPRDPTPRTAANRSSRSRPQPEDGPPPRRPADTLPLPERFTALIGNFPLAVQTFLQGPFTHMRKEPHCDYAYWRWESDRYDELWTWCYIATRSHVTFLRAQRFVAHGADPFGSTAEPWRVVMRYAEGATQPGANVART